MPPEGIAHSLSKEILTYEEMLLLVRIFSGLGVHKIRVTGGEPFVRKGLIDFLQRLKGVPGIKALHITTNGAALAGHLGEMEKLSISGINLSLDTLKPERFSQIVRRNLYANVRTVLNDILKAKIPLKINTVVQSGVNTDEIADIAILTRNQPITVRFIEEMPFNGRGKNVPLCWDSNRIYEKLKRHFPGIRKESEDSGTAALYKIPSFAGQIGIIGAYTREFCGRCDRVRVTPQGVLKTCLYDDGILDMRKMLRGGDSIDDIRTAVVTAVAGKPIDGFAAEGGKPRRKRSMAAIGG